MGGVNGYTSRNQRPVFSGVPPGTSPRCAVSTYGTPVSLFSSQAAGPAGTAKCTCSTSGFQSRMALRPAQKAAHT